MVIAPHKRLINLLTSSEYHRTTASMYGLMVSGVLGVVAAAAASMFPGDLPQLYKNREAILGVSSIGITARLLKEKQQRALRAHIHEWNQQETRKHREITSIHNPSDTLYEKGKDISERGGIIAMLLRQQGLSNVTYAGEFKTGAFTRYLFTHEGFGDRDRFFNEKTTQFISSQLRLPTQPDGRPIMANILETDTGGLAVDIEHHDHSPDRVLPQLKHFVDDGWGRATRLIGVDLTKTPLAARQLDIINQEFTHEIITGATGSAKSGTLRAKAQWDVCRHDETEVRLILADLKNESSSSTWESDWEYLPHLLLPPITTVDQVYMALYALEVLRDARQTFLNQLKEEGVIAEASINSYIKAHHPRGKMSRIYFYVDEAANLPTGGRSHKKTLWDIMAERFTAESRSAGIHLVLGYQRSTSDHLSSHLAANFNLPQAMRTNDLWSAPIALDAGDPTKDPYAKQVALTSWALPNGGLIIKERNSTLTKLQVPLASGRLFDLPICCELEPGAYSIAQRWAPELRLLNLSGEQLFIHPDEIAARCKYGQKMQLKPSRFLAPSYEQLEGYQGSLSDEVEQAKPSDAQAEVERHIAEQEVYEAYLTKWREFAGTTSEATLSAFFKGMSGTNDKKHENHDKAVSYSDHYRRIALLGMHKGVSDEDLLRFFWGKPNSKGMYGTNRPELDQQRKDLVASWRQAYAEDPDYIIQHLIKHEMLEPEEEDEDYVDDDE